MSAILYGLAWRVRGIDNSAKMVLLRLVECADDDGRRIYPSKERLALDCGISVRSVQRILRRFEDIGLIEAVAHAAGGRGRATEYRLSIDALERLMEVIDDPAARLGLREARAARAEGEALGKGDSVSPFSGERVTSETLKGDSIVSPQPSYNPPKVEREAREASEEGDPLADPDFRTMVEAWPNGAIDKIRPAWLAWRKLSPEQRGLAIANLQLWLAQGRGISRKHLPALSTYLEDRGYERLAAPAQAKGGAPASAAPGFVTLEPRTLPIHAVFWGRVRRGELQRARALAGQMFTVPYRIEAAEFPSDAEMAALAKIEVIAGGAPSAEMLAWQDHLGRDGIRLDPAEIGRLLKWFWVPSRWPPGHERAGDGEAAEMLSEGATW